ncbi:hypothetical protein [Vitiosangium sp. GDMCC 1.1324]|uniref:hypothetical protein n=1 Tax=Vitiosangium sp. (strain GDMCC 1.1324) TaxID=2138576 RepID=UPI0011B69069|nr:hypothetical protein [Vitiosangium sp. GDMCC 1.1324]
MPFPPHSPLVDPEPEARPPPGEHETLSRPWRRELPVLVALGLLLVTFVIWALTAEQRALEAMEPPARAVLFDKTWQSFETLCLRGTDPRLLPSCREQARFLRLFPECQDACRERLAPFLPSGTR